MSEEESSTRDTALEKQVRAAFKQEKADFDDRILTKPYWRFASRMYGKKDIPAARWIPYIDEHRDELEKQQAESDARHAQLFGRTRLVLAPEPEEVAKPGPRQEQPDTFLARNPLLRARLDNPEVVRAQIADRFAAKRQPRPTLDKIIPRLRKRDVRLAFNDASMTFVQWRFDGMKLLYDTLYAMRPPLRASKAYWESRLRLVTKQLRKQHPEIADLPDLVTRNIAHAAAEGWQLPYRLQYGANVRMLREAGRNYALQFPDGLGVVALAPSGNQAFNSWLASTTFVLKTVAVWFDEEGSEDWEPHATFQFLEVDVVDVANKLLAKIGGTKLPTEVLQAEVKRQHGLELHDREIAQFMSDETGWHGPKIVRLGPDRVRGYERHI